jgi:hypothetical protein
VPILHTCPCRAHTLSTHPLHDTFVMIMHSYYLHIGTHIRQYVVGGDAGGRVLCMCLFIAPSTTASRYFCVFRVMQSSLIGHTFGRQTRTYKPTHTVRLTIVGRVMPIDHHHRTVSMVIRRPVMSENIPCECGSYLGASPKLYSRTGTKHEWDRGYSETRADHGGHE